MISATVRKSSVAAWSGIAASRSLRVALRPVQVLTAMPCALFLIALVAMLLRHPDVNFFEIDRVAFVLLIVATVGRALITRQRSMVFQRASWPMLGLTLLAVTSLLGQPWDFRSWSLVAAKFVVPFTLFHLSILIFSEERLLRQFEIFCLLILCYLVFVSVAFLLGLHSLIFPRFILDPSLGFHVDRARGPLLQAVANGVSLNLLGLLALHAALRGRVSGVRAFCLLTGLPIAILATMTRAVWLSFAGSMAALIFRSTDKRLRRVGVGLAAAAGLILLVTLSFNEQREALSERFQESGPLDYREAVYAGGWRMFLEKPFTGWGVNQMPAELASHVTGYKETELYPHNTYLELLVEHGIFGLAFYVWLMWEIFRLGRGLIPRAEHSGFLNRQFHHMWPVLLGVYWVNAAVVVMNYQFVNGLIFTLAGMLAAQNNRALRDGRLKVRIALKLANTVSG